MYSQDLFLPGLLYVLNQTIIGDFSRHGSFSGVMPAKREFPLQYQTAPKDELVWAVNSLQQRSARDVHIYENSSHKLRKLTCTYVYTYLPVCHLCKTSHRKANFKRRN